MDFRKIDAALSSALADDGPAPGQPGGKPAAEAARRGERRFDVFVEFVASDDAALRFADKLHLAPPQPGRRVVTGSLTATELDLASEHPAVQRLSLARKLRPSGR